MEIAIGSLFALIGLSVGSFLNVVIDRLPAGQSLAYPPSHCPSCNKPLAVKDLVPLLSYGLLGGRCRYCRSKIPARLPIVEASSGLAFGFLFTKLGLSPELAVGILYFCLMLVIAVIDLEHQLILNRLVYPAAVIALVLSSGGTFLGFAHGMDGAWVNLSVPTLAQSGIGFGAGLVTFFLIFILSRGGMGMGDVKMAALMGLMLGVPNVFVGILIAVLVGGVFAMVLIAVKKKGRKQAIPFGPFLAMGTMIALFWGTNILGWYLRLFNLS